MNFYLFSASCNICLSIETYSPDLDCAGWLDIHILNCKQQEEIEETDVIQEEANVPLLSPLQGYRIQVSNLHVSVTQDDIIVSGPFVDIVYNDNIKCTCLLIFQMQARKKVLG